MGAGLRAYLGVAVGIFHPSRVKVDQALTDDQLGQRGLYWPYDEFAPIVAAIDRLTEARQLGKEEKRKDALDSDYSAKPLAGRPTADEVAAAYAADPWRPRYGANDDVVVLPDGAHGIEYLGKWYVVGSDGRRPDLNQPIEWGPGKPGFRVRQENGSWYAVSDDGKLDLSRPVELVDGHWVETDISKRPLRPWSSQRKREV